ncbi:MAG: NADH-quinone oxidoreductase subunit J [Sphingomonadaceae bacterium]
MEIVYFASLAVLAVLFALAVIVSRNTVHGALFMVAHLFCVAMLYLSLAAEFLAVVQITVYAGAIMVLFLFVITMLTPTREEGPNRILNRLPVAVLLALVFLVGASLMIVRSPAAVAPTASQGMADGGNLVALGAELFTRYLLPFELTSLLLLVAMVAALVLGKRRA